jgi:hypothetical protein
MDKRSKRFTPTWWSERLVPVLLGLILLGLLVTLLITGLSVLGLTPGA